MVCAIEHEVAETIALWQGIETRRPLPFLDHVLPGSRDCPRRADVARHPAAARYRRQIGSGLAHVLAIVMGSTARTTSCV
jgi:hypothetical protein